MELLRRRDRELCRQPALRWHVRAAGGVCRQRSDDGTPASRAWLHAALSRRPVVDVRAGRRSLRPPGRGRRSWRGPARLPSCRGAAGRHDDDRRGPGGCPAGGGRSLAPPAAAGLDSSIDPCRPAGSLRLTPLPRALSTGLLTAFLPCGWLYLFALKAAETGSPLRGALFMIAFWLGSVPALVLVGAGVQTLARLLGTASAAGHGAGDCLAGRFHARILDACARCWLSNPRKIKPMPRRSSRSKSWAKWCRHVAERMPPPLRKCRNQDRTERES